MKLRKIIIPVTLAIALVVAMLLPACIQSGGDAEVVIPKEEAGNNEENYTAKEYVNPNQVDKEEKVYLTCDANGNVTGTKVVVTLKNPGGLENIEDVSILEDIRNSEGNELVQIDGNNLSWENHGEDITYKGTTNEEAPVGIRVTYYLDGAKMDAEAIAGATGHIKIHFDYINRTKGEDYVPFAFATVLNLDENMAQNITLSAGKCMLMSGTQMVIGLGAPGVSDALGLDAENELSNSLKDYFEVEFDAIDFKLEFSETIVTNDLLADLDETKLTDLEKQTGDLAKADEASDQLQDGVEQLSDGLSQYKDGVSAYVDGVDEVAKGAKSLEQGLKSLEQYAAMLPPELAATISQLSTGASGLVTGLDQLTEAGKELKTGGEKLMDGVDALSEGVETLKKDALSQMAEYGSDLNTMIKNLQNLKKADCKYYNFSGISDGKTGSVMYFLETAKIS